ncbi:TetR/AcrR family transcriptional regulator [Iamia sp. SCSIO 61187]|uniref:TetR/AcrR family transcriptional regulator n=1 Tax=Iamia sp. SCSIO 61187 TaxID=2722752 RepID=UPI001C6329A6|nr:TetR/AcrR family transcriptional regulator [Iamia sp. SCSIO 61187]
MNAGPTPRPGGRTARVRAAVLAATGDVLAEHGLGGVDLTEVARRADVGRTTVYRRWGTPAALVADLLEEMAEESTPRAATGSLAGDLEALALLVHRTLGDRRQGRLFAALIAAAMTDAPAAEALERFYDVRIAEWAPCVDDAVARGELDPGTDAEAVIRAVSAPLYYEHLTRTAPVARRTALVAARAAVAAAQAGAYRRDA